MAFDPLQSWSAAVRGAWGPFGMDLIETCRVEMEKLVRAGSCRPWRCALLAEAPANRELYRDPDHGFLLLAHTEPSGLYRVPHDHGRSWVIYAVVQGAVDMGSYGWVEGAAGPELVRQTSTVMRAGDVRVYLPGDVHDTICLAGPALLLRFTARDLQVEKAEGRLTRYVEQNGRWTARAA